MDVNPDFRQMRGLAIVREKGGQIRTIVETLFLVPSQSNSGGYLVDKAKGSCTCPDFSEWGPGHRCKHLWAVLVLTREVEMPDGTTVVAKKKITIKRNWRAHTAASRHEKARVQTLLHALCQCIKQPPYKGNGRPPLPLSAVVYGAAMKVYCNASGRNAETDIEWCREKGFVETVPSFNSIYRYLESPKMTPLLQVMIAESASPLAACETEKQYAVDATGFATTVYGGWFEHKHGATQKRRKAKYLKSHVIAGTHTHAVMYVEPTEGHVQDSPLLPLLVEKTAERHSIAEVSGDAGYLSKVNAEAIAKVHAVPFISFKDNSTGSKGPEAWMKMWAHFTTEKDDYMKRYHRRSNVETVFQMVKQRWGDSLSSRTLTAQFNEILLKYLCHNLACLNMAIENFGIEPKFNRVFGLPEDGK